MARNTIVQVSDDLDGSADAEQVNFSYQGVDYTIDLSKKNRTALEKALKPYLEVATRAPKSRTAGRRRSASGGSSSKRDLAAVRAWAREQGLEVSDRGRVPHRVVEQYEASH